MKNAALLVILLVVAVISYGLGRKHGASARTPISATPTTTDRNTERVSLSKADTQTRTSPVREHSAPSDTGMPFAQNMSSFAQGYEAAKANLDEALSRIETLPVPERMGFITGIFSFVARNHSPADALQIYQRVPAASRPNALRALVGEWIYTRSPLDEDMRHIKREGTLGISGFRLGLEVELTSMLASTKPDAELASAWLDAFSNHSSRSEMLLSLAGSLGPNKHETVLDHMEGWTPWEKERVTRSVLGNWSDKAPKEAWDWYQANRNRFDQDFSSSILEGWASSDPAGLQGLLNSMEQPAQRKEAIEALGKALARKNTDEAVNWANGLADATEREVANRAVYDGAPRGIGAVLGVEEGFPMIRAIVPGSPLDGSGVQPGDRILELWEGNGSKQSVYAKDLNTTVNLIRGESGSELTLRLLRQNKNTGQLEEHLVPVTRGQLYLNEKALPDRDFRKGP
jgi:hypothetical protein